MCSLPLPRLLLRHCFVPLPSTQVATLQCSVQTTPAHILQKLTQMSLTLSTNVGRVLTMYVCMYYVCSCIVVLWYIQYVN